MSHRRIAIAMSCLLALVCCQVAAAAGACGPVTPLAATAGSAGGPPAGCHDGDDSVRCEGCDALAANAQGAKALADAAHEFPAAPSLVVAHTVGVAAGHANRALPSRTPPHFLGRLLI